MKQSYILSLVLLLIGSSLNAMGMNKEPYFKIGEFHSVQVNIPCTMTLIRGDGFLMDIEAAPKHIQELEIYNEKGTLIFKYAEKKNLRLSVINDPKITLTMPEWKNIQLTSSADISSHDYWENGKISIQSSGSGNIEIETVSCASIKIKNSASGDVEMGDVKAESGMFEFKSSGSGDNSFDSVFARNIQLLNQSSGEINGNFNSDSLEVKLSGSGDAKLKGSTGVASLHTSGSGSVDAAEMMINEANISGSGSGDIYLKKGTFIRKVRFSGSGNLIEN